MPEVVIDRVQTHRPRIEASMTAGLTERLRVIGRGVNEYGGR